MTTGGVRFLGGLMVAGMVMGIHLVAVAEVGFESPHSDLGLACERCHSSSAWSPLRIGAEFDHRRFGFSLSGAHARLDCMDCHQDLRFSFTGSECSDCHMDVHQGQLGLDCDRCHGSRSFIDVVDQRRLHREERFPLSGAHATAPCESCHPVGMEGILEFLGVDSACVACHEAEYSGAKDPDHVANAFSQDCEFCHSTRTFVGGFFNHERQLGGASLVCAECHQSAYDATSNPRHADLGFSTECQLCHNTRRWEDAECSHRDYFPINSGAHRGKWDVCSDCHVNSSDFGDFECVGCHPHSDRSKTDGDHREVSGYSYDSFACFDCHPRGKS